MDTMLDSLNPCVEYDAYVYSVCDDGWSEPSGPVSFATTTTESCTYTFNLFDSFGDGWNGAFLLVEYNGDSLIYDIPSGGESATFVLEAFSSIPISISYFSGDFDAEVTFDITSSTGTVMYSDGPNPVTGNILDFILSLIHISEPTRPY